jgi:hypothetical protein
MCAFVASRGPSRSSDEQRTKSLFGNIFGINFSAYDIIFDINKQKGRGLLRALSDLLLE